MLIIRGTKKLRDRIRSAAVVATEGDESTTELGDWFATALFWKPQMVLLVNTRTMLPVFLPLVPAATLLDRAPEAIAQVLRAHGVPDDVVASELEAMTDTRIAPTNDRQIVGVMNELVFQGEGHWPRHAPDALSLSMRLSDVILGPLMQRHDTPRDELAAVFGGDAKVIPFPTVAKPDAAAAATRSGRQLLQLKITLNDIEPPIWRRVVVDGDETLQHLHDVIQAAFGWFDAHLHGFQIGDAHYGIPSVDDWRPVVDERTARLGQVLTDDMARYSYDFGDGWEHDIVVEETRLFGSTDAPTAVPGCIGGRRADPPEDCGGPWGYSNLIEVLADPKHPEHEDLAEWLGRPLDPEAFDRSEFSERLRQQQAPRSDG